MSDKEEPGRDDFLLVIRPHVDSDNKWIGEVSINIISSDNNQLDDDDYLSLMDYARFTAASVPVMELNPRYKNLIEQQADKYLPKAKIKRRVASCVINDNVIKVNFEQKD